MVLGTIATIVSLVASWMVFKKMGREGWEGIIPLYNTYVLCDVLYGNGWKFLLLLIPFYNIYFSIKMIVDQAHAFNKSTGFAIGMLFFPYIFLLILGFGDAVFGNGCCANNESDFVSDTVNKTKEAVSGIGKDDQALEKLQQLADLKEKGIISEEEYEAKRAELLKRI